MFHQTTKAERSRHQLDEIGRRMAHVIEKEDAAAMPHSAPHWELLYNERQDCARQLLHLHGDETHPAVIARTPEGGTLGSCSTCGATLEISNARAA